MMAQNAIPDRLGPYRLLRRLGEGGMGVVYLAEDPAQQMVAVKALRPSVAAEPTARQRLAREVETMRRVHSPFVAEVIDADVTGEPPYIVTRHVPGRTLDDIVTEAGPLTGTALARLAYGLAAALTAVHAAGVVHRDLKPGNVLLVADEPVVIDFGIAQVPEATRITLTGMFMGTPGFLAPEVIEGKPGGCAADVHSWGATVAFAATGRPPFGTGSFETIFYRIVHGQPDLGQVPAPLVPLLARALARDPAGRPAAAELTAMAAALDPAALAPAGGTPADWVQSGSPAVTVIEGPAGPARPGRPAVPAVPAVPLGYPAAARTGQPLAPSSTRPFAVARPAGLAVAGPAAGSAAASSAADFRDMLPPVSYVPAARPALPAGPRAPQSAAPDRAAPDRAAPDRAAPDRAAAPVSRSAWSPLVLGTVAVGIAASIVLPLVGTAAALAALIMLRAGERTGIRLARRRARQGRRVRDSVLAVVLFPLACCRSLARFALLSPLALLGAGVVAAITIILVPQHPLPRAFGYAAGTLVAFYSLGPGSGACRRPLGRFFGATARTRVRAAAALIAIVALAAAAIVTAASQSPVYWPAGNLSAQLAHLPALHSVITDIRLNIIRLAGSIGL